MQSSIRNAAALASSLAMLVAVIRRYRYRILSGFTRNYGDSMESIVNAPAPVPCIGLVTSVENIEVSDIVTINTSDSDRFV
jgi:hypothetical protein